MSLLIESLPVEEQADAADAVSGCPTVALPSGSIRTPARMPAASLLVVEEGIVLVTSLRPGAGRRMIVAVAGPGAVLPPPADDERLEALGDAWLTSVCPHAYERLLELPGAARVIVDALTDQLRERQESLSQFSSVRHVERVREKLLQLARTHGRVMRDGIKLDLPLTHELVGEMVGSARETVTWAFAELAREGFVQRVGRSYRLSVRPEALAS
jgi:CRP-like cAMP-binding protein